MLQSKVFIVIVTVLLILMIDIHFVSMVRRATAGWHKPWRQVLLVAVGWIPMVLAIVTVAAYYLADRLGLHVGISQWVMTILMLAYLTKVIPVGIGLLEETWIGGRRVVNRFSRRPAIDEAPVQRKIKRSEFLAKSALAVAAIPFSTGVFAIAYGTYNYQVRRHRIYLPNLPGAFDGIRIGHLSDIHTSAAYHHRSFASGIELFQREKPDVVFFTGDLVNYSTREAYPYTPVLEKIRAPLGVFSVTGNHDYGDYISWRTQAAKEENFASFIALHKALGYRLLMNENHLLESGGEQLAIIGVENWGMGRFPKYGKLDMAYGGTEEVPVKLLLSHDPSHWNLQVRPDYPSIDLTFSGHTHGFQLGIETPDFRWSPAQYAYQQWAGLYREGSQYLYVNRGYGCLGFMGRLGINPELTIIELKKGLAPNPGKPG